MAGQINTAQCLKIQPNVTRIERNSTFSVGIRNFFGHCQVAVESYVGDKLHGELDFRIPFVLMHF